MNLEKLQKNAQIIVGTCCRVKAGEKVLVITEKTSKKPYLDELAPITRALEQAGTGLGAQVTVMDISGYLNSAEFKQGRVLETLRRAIETSDAVISAVDYINFTRFTGETEHGDKYITAAQRCFALQSHGMDRWDITAEQVAAIPVRTDRLLKLVQAAREGHITSPAGTDFYFKLGKEAAANPFKVLIPLFGELAIVPAPGREHGIFVVDGPTQKGVRTRHELDREPLRITVENGQVRDYTGDPEQVGRLKGFIENGDPRADRIDEVGIVTCQLKENDDFWWEDGTHHHDTIHIALGNNLHKESRVHGAAHMDGEVIKPTVRIDGTVIIKDGMFRDDNF